jgi:hypothetical protein
MNENGRFLISYSNLKYRQDSTSKALLIMEEAKNYFCDISFCIKLAKLYEEVGEYQKEQRKT